MMVLASIYFRTFISGILISFSFLLVSCDSDTQVAKYDLNDRVEQTRTENKSSKLHTSENVLIFGFDLRSSPQEDARQYLPFLKYLERETGYKFKLHFTPSNKDIADDLGNNRVQFAALGAVSFLQANAQYGVIPLVRGVNLEGKAEYQSVFVVAPKSKIKVITDIKGKRLSFGSRTSTQGHLIPRIVLKDKGLQIEKLASVRYTGSHQNCANAVISSKSDVCSMQDTMAKIMAKQGLLRIIHSSNYYPSSGIAANQDIPDEVVNKVKQALLNFKPQGKNEKGLYNWERTEMPLGFTEAKIDDYAELRKWSVRLGFVHEVKKAGK